MMKNWLSEHGWKTVKSFWRHWYPSGMQSYNKLASYPLLDTQTILGLKEQIQIHQNNSSNHKEIQHPMTGDSRSIFRGGGLDFEESRMYQAGDDLRYMNWRLTARSGEPYMKVFREERQPGIFIVVDRRPSMRFGTKKRLKVTQAAYVAAVGAFVSLSKGASIGGVLLQPNVQWLSGGNGNNAALAFIQAAAAPCPPLSVAAEDPPLTYILNILPALLIPGTVILLISDFYGLQQSDLPLLLQLTSKHSVMAVQIIDPAEQNFPDVGHIVIEAPEGGKPISVNSSDPQMRTIYESRANELIQQHHDLLATAGIHIKHLTTDQSALDLLEDLSLL